MIGSGSTQIITVGSGSFVEKSDVLFVEWSDRFSGFFPPFCPDVLQFGLVPTGSQNFGHFCKNRLSDVRPNLHP